MSGNPQNPLAGLMALLGNNPAATAAPQQQAPPQQGQAAVPQGGGASTQPSPPPPMQSAPGMPQQPQQGGMNPMIQGLMQQSQQAMNSPMGQPVPQGGGLAALAQHPLIQAMLKAAAGAAQSYGWTAMQPQERLERTQMQQQKGESLAKLGLGGAEYEGSLAVRQQLADTNQQKANTLEERAKTAEQNANTQGQRADAYDRAVNARADYDQTELQVTKALGQRRADIALSALSEKADDFTRKLEQDKGLAQQNIGIKNAHQTTYNGYVGMLGQVKDAAVQQGNTKIAEQAQQKLAEIQSKSWVQDLFGMAGPSTAAGAAQAVGKPQALPSVVPQPSTTGAQPAQNKAQAKNKQAAPQGAAPQRPPNVPAGAQWDTATRTWRM